MFSSSLRFSLWCLILSACGVSAAAGESTQTPAVDTRTAAFQFDAATTVLSTQDMDRNGLMFPDGPMGFVRREGSDQYYISGAGGSFGGVGRSAHLPAGSYAFKGTLDVFVPAKRKNGWPAYSLTSGRQQPSPDGMDFDRDYAGGGPTYLFCAATLMLQIYHGEFHLLPNKGLPAYGGSGMAVSRDDGETFAKIGQILAPHLSREEFIDEKIIAGLWADGAMVEADGHGRPRIDSTSRRGTLDSAAYYYMIFTDHNVPRERYTGLSIARAGKIDVLNAIAQNKAPLFRKYYNSSGVFTFDGDYFTEPGIGGRSTPILFSTGEYINTPGILYSSYLQRFLLFYQVNQRQIVFRTSANLLLWSEPVIAFRLDPSSNRRVFYPSVAGVGTDPQDPGEQFYLYFLVREQVDSGAFINPQLMREQVHAIP